MTQRRPRLFDPGYLTFLRKQRCCVCNRAAPSEAAHIRMTALEAGKSITGMGRKPDDKDAVPLCAWCHRESPESQHNIGNETVFWSRYDIDPIALAAKLYAEYGGTGGRPRKQRPVKARRPRHLRSKIRTGKIKWPTRPFQRS